VGEAQRFPNDVARNRRSSASRKTLDENLTKALTDVDPTVELYAESLEDYRFGGEPHIALMRNYLRSKYAGMRLDAVIAVTDPAVIFMANYGEEIFPGVPVAYLKTLPYDGQESTAGVTGITGFGALVAGSSSCSGCIQHSPRLS
jgi:hypothetical protein